MRLSAAALLISTCCCVLAKTHGPQAVVVRCGHARAQPDGTQLWHGLGDSYDADGMKWLANSINERFNGTFVHIIRQAEDGAADRKATFFGNAAEQVDTAYSQLLALPELRNGFDAVGFSQGGVLLRALVQKYASELPPIRRLITLGSPHLGVNRLPPCKEGDWVCRATEWALRAGVWSSYAQSRILPAQYFRDQEDVSTYLVKSGWLREVNNERWGDRQVGGSEDYLDGHDGEGADRSKRNAQYAKNLASLERFVLISFSNDTTINPPTSALFTLPNSTTGEPIPLKHLPLYAEDYIGLRQLDRQEALVRNNVCDGEHMQIDQDCWTIVLDSLDHTDENRDVGQTNTADRVADDGRDFNPSGPARFVVQH